MSLTLLNLDTPAQSEINAAKRRDAQDAPAQRNYAAGRVNRLSNDFAQQANSINRELYSGLRRMRARSRDLARNNPYAKRFFQLLKDNVVGHGGIRLQIKERMAGQDAGQTALASALPAQIEGAWEEWGHSETASVSGKLSWIDWQKLAIATMARDGEALFRLRAAENEFGFALQQIDAAWLDENYNEVLPSGNRVIMSVEVNDDYKPQAYYLTPPADWYPAARPTTPMRRVRVPASEMIHLFAVDEGEEQVRGVPWFHAALLKLHREGKYEEAELVAACVEACKMMIATPPADISPDELDALPEALPDQVSPGQVIINRPGWTVETFDPKRPSSQFQAFTNAVLYGVAAGLGVSHASLTGDLSQVNYSSIRWGGLQERDFWRGWQHWAIEHLHRPVFRAWLNAAWLAGALPNIKISQLPRLKAAWYPRGWAWVDPQKEIAADVLAINNGLDSRTRVVSEMGLDYPDLVAELKAEKELLDAAGLQFGLPAAPAPTAAPSEEKTDGATKE